MTKVMIIEDEVKVAQLVRDYLLRESFEVVMLHDGLDAMAAIRREAPDLLILDLMLPGCDGLTICRQLRASSQSHIPVIMLTARVQETDTIVGLETGADDYVRKPFRPGELVARVRALLRRAGGTPSKQTKFAFGVTLNMDKHVCTQEGVPVELTPVEFRILDTLMAQPGRVWSRDALMEAAYDDDRIVSRRTVDSHVNNLRAKLTVEGSEPVIRSVYGVGYAFGPG